jgi:Mn2+/Fe2+ NRAMP family transporter
MPFLAGTLLYMNSKREWLGDLRTGWLLNSLLVMALLLFLYLGINQLIDVFT